MQTYTRTYKTIHVNIHIWTQTQKNTYLHKNTDPVINDTGRNINVETNWHNFLSQALFSVNSVSEKFHLNKERLGFSSNSNILCCLKHQIFARILYGRRITDLEAILGNFQQDVIEMTFIKIKSCFLDMIFNAIFFFLSW